MDSLQERYLQSEIRGWLESAIVERGIDPDHLPTTGLDTLARMVTEGIVGGNPAGGRDIEAFVLHNPYLSAHEDPIFDVINEIDVIDDTSGSPSETFSRVRARNRTAVAEAAGIPIPNASDSTEPWDAGPLWGPEEQASWDAMLDNSDDGGMEAFHEMSREEQQAMRLYNQQPADQRRPIFWRDVEAAHPTAQVAQETDYTRAFATAYEGLQREAQPIAADILHEAADRMANSVVHGQPVTFDDIVQHAIGNGGTLEEISGALSRTDRAVRQGFINNPVSGDTYAEDVVIGSPEEYYASRSVRRVNRSPQNVALERAQQDARYMDQTFNHLTSGRYQSPTDAFFGLESRVDNMTPEMADEFWARMSQELRNRGYAGDPLWDPATRTASSADADVAWNWYGAEREPFHQTQHQKKWALPDSVDPFLSQQRWEYLKTTLPPDEAKARWWAEQTPDPKMRAAMEGLHPSSLPEPNVSNIKSAYKTLGGVLDLAHQYDAIRRRNPMFPEIDLTDVGALPGYGKMAAPLGGASGGQAPGLVYNTDWFRQNIQEGGLAGHGPNTGLFNWTERRQPGGRPIIARWGAQSDPLSIDAAGETTVSLHDPTAGEPTKPLGTFHTDITAPKEYGDTLMSSSRTRGPVLGNQGVAGWPGPVPEEAKFMYVPYMSFEREARGSGLGRAALMHAIERFPNATFVPIDAPGGSSLSANSLPGTFSGRNLLLSKVYADWPNVDPADLHAFVQSRPENLLNSTYLNDMAGEVGTDQLYRLARQDGLENKYPREAIDQALRSGTMNDPHYGAWDMAGELGLNSLDPNSTPTLDEIYALNQQQSIARWPKVPPDEAADMAGMKFWNAARRVGLAPEDMVAPTATESTAKTKSMLFDRGFAKDIANAQDDQMMRMFKSGPMPGLRPDQYVMGHMRPELGEVPSFLPESVRAKLQGTPMSFYEAYNQGEQALLRGAGRLARSAQAAVPKLEPNALANAWATVRRPDLRGHLPSLAEAAGLAHPTTPGFFDPAQFEEAWRAPTRGGLIDLYKRMDPLHTAYSDVPGAYEGEPWYEIEKMRQQEAQERSDAQTAERYLGPLSRNRPPYEFSRSSGGTW